MNNIEAEKKICPYNSNKCITSSCMMWVVTANGKKEIDRKKVPYELTPMGESDWRKSMIKDGYINEGCSNGGWVDNYVKYLEVYEGYCYLRGGKND